MFCLCPGVKQLINSGDSVLIYLCLYRNHSLAHNLFDPKITNTFYSTGARGACTHWWTFVAVLITGPAKRPIRDPCVTRKTRFWNFAILLSPRFAFAWFGLLLVNVETHHQDHFTSLSIIPHFDRYGIASDRFFTIAEFDFVKMISANLFITKVKVQASENLESPVRTIKANVVKKTPSTSVTWRWDQEHQKSQLLLLDISHPLWCLRQCRLNVESRNGKQTVTQRKYVFD